MGHLSIYIEHMAYMLSFLLRFLFDPSINLPDRKSCPLNTFPATLLRAIISTDLENWHS